MCHRPPGGDARLHAHPGTVRFLKNGNVRIAGKINDVCPQGGYGPYVYFKGSGGLGAYGSAKDLRGCEEAAVSFAFTRTPESYEGSIDEVVISLREYDQINPPSGIYKRGDVNSFTVTRR